MEPDNRASVTVDRRSLLLAASGLLLPSMPFFAGSAGARRRRSHQAPADSWFSVRDFGAKGDGRAIDSGAINRAIDHAASLGGGTVWFPAGTYLSYSIRLKSNITVFLGSGAILIAASVPFEGLASGGYDAAEPIDAAIEHYQDYGHSHWHNSLIWGEGLHDIAITGPGLIWGKGLAKDWADHDGIAGSRKPGVGDKSIALKNCHNVTLRDFKVLQGGWFCLLATGVDNLTIDNVTVDTNRDGFDIDCCRNVRVTNCTVNSPWDDGICPKSSFALGYPRATENVTIANCFCSGRYEMGSVIDGSWKRRPAGFQGNGRIKCGTESNGGFKNIAITNCVIDQASGIALETVDGATLEDITISNIAMRGVQTSPFFLRLGRRMRGPPGTPIGTLKRVLIDNISSYDGSTMPSTIAGVAGHPVENVKISNVYLHQRGGQTEDLSRYCPETKEDAYPEPGMFGKLPATALWARHARNLDISNMEVAIASADNRPALWLEEVGGADIFNLKAPRGPSLGMINATDVRVFGSRTMRDWQSDKVDRAVL